MKYRVVLYVVYSLIAAPLITGATFFVTEAGYHSLSGFPLPFSTFYPCCSGYGDAATGVMVNYNNTYVYNIPNFVVDVAAWFALSVAVLLTVSKRRFLTRLSAAGAGGIGVTLVTWFVPPLSISAWASPETEQFPMGFPYAYVAHYFSYAFTLDGVTTSSGYIYSASAALADFALWTLVLFVAIEVTVSFHAKYFSIRQNDLATPQPNVEFQASTNY